MTTSNLNDKIFSGNNGAYHAISKGKNGVSQWRLEGNTLADGFSRYGHKMSGQGGKIDNGLLTGRMTVDELRQLAGAGRGKPAKIGNARVNNHFRALREKKGYNVAIDSKGRCYVENCAISKAAHNAVIERETARKAEHEAAKVKHVRRQAAIKGMKRKAKKA